MNTASSDYQNEGLVCWDKCGGKDNVNSVNSQCNYCGKKGICCRQGVDKKECDGSVGGFNRHECTKPAAEGKI